MIGELREDVGKLGLEAARIGLEMVNFLEIWWPTFGELGLLKKIHLENENSGKL